MKNILLLLTIGLLAGCSKTEYSSNDTSTSPSPGADRYRTTDTNASATVRVTPMPADTESTTIRPSDRELLEQRIETASSELSQLVQTTLRSDSKFSELSDKIQITASSDGTVTLRGSVASATEKTDLANKISSMAGVKRVDNQLTLSSDAATQENKPYPQQPQQPQQPEKTDDAKPDKAGNAPPPDK